MLLRSKSMPPKIRTMLSQRRESMAPAESSVMDYQDEANGKESP